LPNLKLRYKCDNEAGCDEAGRGCLAGPVVAAAVILPPDYKSKELNDSKQLNHRQREKLRIEIEKEAITWSYASLDNHEIDKLNILWASVEAMHRAVKSLREKPEFLLIDGNKFKPYHGIPHQCFVKGDGKWLCIAAASVIAKTYRDDLMTELHKDFPEYEWKNNKGYPTKKHREAIAKHGPTPFHRMSFKLSDSQLQLF